MARVQTIFNATLLPQRVAQLWTGFQFLQRCCNKLIVMIHAVEFWRNNVALEMKNVYEMCMMNEWKNEWMKIKEWKKSTYSSGFSFFTLFTIIEV